MAKNLNLIYRIQGARIDEGVDVYDLAPALLSLADLINKSNRIINPHGVDLGVNIKPFEKGSFIVDIAIFAKPHLQQLMDFAGSTDGKNLRSLLEMIGLIGGGTIAGSIGLIKLIKLLKGTPKKVEKLEDNTVKFIGNDNVAYIVKPEVYNLYASPEIVPALDKAYSKLLTQDGIDKVESYLKDSGDDKVDVSKNDFVYFREIVEAQKLDEIEMLEIDEENDNESESIIYVQPKRGSFDGDSRRWSFYEGSDKNRIITADIKDEDFLQGIVDGRIRLHHTDILKVRIKTTQKIKDQNISTKHVIEKVMERIEAPRQESF